MDKAELQRMKQQLVDNATAQIGEIKVEGIEKRSQISFIKDSITTSIVENEKAKELAEAEESAKREKLLKLLGEAASTGNLDEMKRIRSLLEKP